MPRELANKILTQMNQLILGKEHQVRLALTCLLAKGHLLIEDLPGMGKTTLAHGLAQSLGLSYQRIQFTSDLLPADIVGLSIFDQNSQRFTLHKGPIFSQLLLADEINRASPKAQSALLEAMEEHQVSIDGQSHPLPVPFFVIATQNPAFHAGTYPLPESQLDRFMMKIAIGFPEKAAEKQMLKTSSARNENHSVPAVIDETQLLQMMSSVQAVHCSEAVIDYVIKLCQYTRDDEFTGYPLSPRASKALIACAKAWAFIEGRDHLIPDDIQAVFIAVSEHRIGHLSSANLSAGQPSLAQQVLNNVAVID
ncbi:AAA family ATPase [Thalassotalea sp. LPB0316]|uniref:AAA family ATPase n=1 Tax=Thalassotalea sp. LPB0316 TaxID=2769490 RepID=UPI001867B589|nr:AAA family ATPase [Thalassotalea sp. LPB0316]QOL25387.1 AAA family ATPase [Thalassotalea sp. LPB0316]